MSSRCAAGVAGRSHRRRLVGFLAAILLGAAVLGASATAHAEPLIPPAKYDFAPFNLLARTNQHKDIGNVEGYTTAGVLIGPQYDRLIENGFLFVDVRGHVENRGTLGINAALGVRYVDWGEKRGDGTVDYAIWGMHAGYDYRRYQCLDREVCNKVDLNWINLGIEYLRPDFDIRANGYIVPGRATTEGTCCKLKFVRFEANAMIVAPLYTESMPGFDIELGVPVTRHLAKATGIDFKRLDLDVYAAIGMYHFISHSDKDATGVRGRVTARIRENIALGVQTSWDTRFGWNIMGQVALTWGEPARSDRRQDRSEQDALKRLTEFRQRQELVVAGEGLSKRTRTLTDAAGNPIPFVHVDNTAAPNGDGTFERKYNLLTSVNGPGSKPGDVIVVYRGDGTTTGYNQGVTLKNDQVLIGAQLLGEFVIKGVKFCAEFFGGRPTITNDNNANIVTLADNNYLRGIDIRLRTIAPFNAPDPGDLHNAIAGSNITNFTMSDVRIFGDFSPRGIGNDREDALQIIGARGNITLIGNVVLGVPDEGFDIRAINNDVVNITIANNFIQNSEDGILLRGLDNAQVTFSITDNVLRRNPLAVLNVVTNSGAAMYLQFQNAAIARGLVARNDLDGDLTGGNTGQYGIIAGSLNSANLRITIDGNEVRNYSLLGILGATSSTGFFNVRNNVVNIAGPNGIDLRAQGVATADACALVTGNTTTPSFQLRQTTGTFRLEPMVGNTGPVVTTGTITAVPSGTCGF
ncbi:MAG: hypothetical protein AB7G15_11520 [Alphaproteobacteria bacterium]